MDRRRISPIIFILGIMFLLNLTRGGFSDPLGWILNKLLILPAIIIGLTFHEAAHGYVSHWLGDPTPENQGRLTLSPLSHIDPMGFIALMLAGFGWGVPVQIDPRYYKHPRRDEFLVAIAGVSTNFIIAVIFALVQAILIKNNVGIYGDGWQGILITVIMYIIVINIVLMVFNLLPIPPLDGFSILTQIFDLRKYNWYYNLYNKGFFILIIFVLLGITDGFLTKSVSTVYRFIIDIAFKII